MSASSDKDYVDVLLQGTSAAPLPLADPAGHQADAANDGIKAATVPKFDDLGFLDHIDSGFNDFNDRWGG